MNSILHNSSTAPTRLSRWLSTVPIVLMGFLVGYFTYQLLQMQLRYAIASVVGLSFLTLCMIFIRRLPEILLYLMVLSIPLFTFEKTFFLRDTWVHFGMPGINIGVLDFLLTGLYLCWAVEIVILRNQPIPKPTGLDALIGLFILAHALSAINSASVAYTLFELFRVSKYALAYFYVAHRLERRHLKYIVLALIGGLIFESSLGVYQHRTQKLVGIARSKGAMSAEMEAQYEVPEFEGHRRAEGTTIDSHALGVYLCMLLAFPLCLSLCPWLKNNHRFGLALVTLTGIPGLIATFSRGAWGALLFSVLLILVVFFLWKERRALGLFLILCMLASPAILVGGGKLIGKRIFRAPGEIMDARWDTVLTGYEIWKRSPWVGGGANAYFHAQRDLGMIYELTNDKPAHNLAVYLLSQIGLMGLTFYVTLGIWVAVLCVRVMQFKDPLLSPLALAVFAGMLAVQADGAIDFMAFTNQPYFMQFLGCGLVAGMVRLLPTTPAKEFSLLLSWSSP